MQSGPDSSDSRYDSSESRDDSRYEAAEPRPRNRARLPVVLTYTGLSINMFVLLAAVWGLLYAGMLNILLLPVLALLAVSALTVNVLAFVFGRLAARSEIPADGKAACRVCAVVALLQVLTVLALTFVAVERLWGQLFPAPMVTKPTTAVPATYQVVQPPAAADERPTVQSRPTVREKGQ